MSLTPEWTQDVGGIATKLQYHATPGLLAVGIDGDSAAGPGVAFLWASDGNRMGTLETTGSLQRTEYHDRAELVFAVTDDDHVYALDPETADLRWDTQASAIAAATDETVFLRGGSTVWAHDAESGTRKWRQALPDTVYGGSTYVDGTLFVQVGEWQNEGVVAIDAASGDEEWYYRPGAAENVLVGDHGIYTGFDDEDRETELASLNSTTGVEQWAYDTGRSYLSVEPTESAVYLRKQNTAVALNPVTGREIWTSEEYYDFEELLVEDGNVYGCVETPDLHDYSFVRLDPDTGRTLWEIDLKNQNWSTAGLTADDGDVYVGTDDYHDDEAVLYRLNGATGSPYWEFPVDETINDIAGEGDPVLTLSSNTLYAVDTETGRAAWSFADESLFVNLAADRRVVLAGSGRQYVLDRETGAVEATIDTDGPVTAFDGALFEADGSLVTASAVAERPGAFGGDAAEKAGSNTTVYDDTAEVAGETGVYDEAADSAAADGDPDAGGDTAEAQNTTSTVSFCPNCGTDLDAFGDVNFCPECGMELR